MTPFVYLNGFLRSCLDEDYETLCCIFIKTLKKSYVFSYHADVVIKINLKGDILNTAFVKFSVTVGFLPAPTISKMDAFYSKIVSKKVLLIWTPPPQKKT